MSGANSDHLHRSTLSIYSHLMEQFNPGLQQLVTLGNSYVKAFQALALTSEAYFSALTKMGEQALHTLSSRSLGDVLIQISETQRKLTAEVEGVFCWFQVEVLQALDKNVRLDEEYIGGSRRVYELEVRNQAANLERQLRRGAYRDSLLRAAVSSLLQPGDRDEGWPGQDNQLGRVPSRAPSPLQTRSRSGSVSESPTVSGGQSVRALVSHPASSNPVLLPFSRGDTITLLVPEPRNGWMYGRHDASLRQGWFPASYIAPVEDLSSLSSSGASLRNHSMNNLLEPTSQSESVDNRNYGEIPPPAPPLPRGSNDLRTLSPLLDRKAETVYEVKAGQSYSEIPPPAPPIRRASGDFRPVSPLLDRRAESHFESMTGYSVPERKAEPNVERPNPHRQMAEHPLFPRGSNPFATVKLRPTVTNDRSAPRIH
ncbi:brain-specific angiogenesis inhibitor 1-associated protein 2-like protein 2 isoform X2 [Hemibagrus wyckioides]|uniref:brain-specific angiogenesis inhibitor 1-associated protein 2-like protein 2 isoform X2 n=1 Tax=Hemibagrus wyckioides TaxID=337641 RepID=UPI00266B750F|nr:brain-specific angiogenesis inhibitor 1-associated protein 2-like protein 2 isoform X2 [Hemibagrus wyckioides]